VKLRWCEINCELARTQGFCVLCAVLLARKATRATRDRKRTVRIIANETPLQASTREIEVAEWRDL